MDRCMIRWGGKSHCVGICELEEAGKIHLFQLGVLGRHLRTKSKVAHKLSKTPASSLGQLGRVALGASSMVQLGRVALQASSPGQFGRVALHRVDAVQRRCRGVRASSEDTKTKAIITPKSLHDKRHRWRFSFW